MSSSLERSIDACLASTADGNSFRELRQLVLQRKTEVQDPKSLPDALVLRMLTCFAGASQVQSNLAVEGVRIIGVPRAAALAKSDRQLLRKLQRIFAAEHEANQFHTAFEGEFNIVGEGDGAVKPDSSKAEEVMRMQEQYKKEWPNLHARFQQGVASEEPDIVLNLVLETVDYILTPLKKMNRTRYRQESDMDGSIIQLPYDVPVIVVVGITGSGKSVTCNWLAGSSIEKVPDCDEDGDEEGTRLQVHNPEFAVGHDSFNSQTFAPTVKELSDYILVDFPGTCDTSGVEIRIGMDIAFREMVRLVQPVHVLGLLPIESFTIGRGTIAKQQISKLQRLLPTLGTPLGADHFAAEGSASTWKVGVTKCDKDFTTKPKALFKEAVKFLTEFDKVLEPHIVNINALIFSGKESDRKELIGQLLRDTKITGGHGLAEWLTKKIWGGECGGIASDCLNPNDAAGFGRVFMTEQFEKSFIEHDLAQVKRCTSFADSPSSWGEEATWESFSSLIDEQVQELGKYTAKIVEDSEQLLKHGTLSLERRSPAIKKLCAFNQCRLKLCFVQAEENIMMSNLKSSIQLNEELYKSARSLRTEGFIRDTDFAQVLEAYEESSQTMDRNARSVGFNDTKSLLDNVSLFGGVAACGGLVTGGVTAAYSTTLAGAWAGTGTLSTAAASGLATGGLALVIGAAVLAVACIAKKLRAHGDQYSEQMKDKLKSAFNALMEANDAATKHKTALGGITSILRSLEVQLRD